MGPADLVQAEHGVPSGPVRDLELDVGLDALLDVLQDLEQPGVGVRVQAVQMADHLEDQSGDAGAQGAHVLHAVGPETAQGLLQLAHGVVGPGVGLDQQPEVVEPVGKGPPDGGQLLLGGLAGGPEGE